MESRELVLESPTITHLEEVEEERRERGEGGEEGGEKGGGGPHQPSSRFVGKNGAITGPVTWCRGAMVQW